MNHDLLSLSEVADALGVTTRTIRNYLSDGKLKGQKIGGQWKFLKSEVYRFIGQSVENPVTNFFENENNFKTGSILVINIPISSMRLVENLKNDLLNQYNNVYDGENRQFFYQAISKEQARVIIQGTIEYVASFGDWINNRLRSYS
ncbi:helix-turn-helix domain-containing protein [Enterococcus gallinarum]|uniref:Helix-turn-helix domain-containing protein n=1 Tax=Enterococcus gallinarum TaxID=1353 RepID=A0ABD4HMT1_ENTGA|nr:helix-turn-helix domain-containing protein [Enterococcus gallinarum]MBA0946998.1 helix-turn-helix domain-containing protein [Enterococcus gallinarum]MBA0960132.1 helix-turn-helix domain-containing protein [Enterococcus gallinarum]MBA0968077.1 helix-turn-helix domain-containing protein [Enterococcus gallinarum]MBA0972824.1 helix-turn-helix domain-containing protein [Enterococcus gallinarum]MCR1931725.1 helix-turn-helix domain-containing protein [Enterococcus gallinarum]